MTPATPPIYSLMTLRQ